MSARKHPSAAYTNRSSRKCRWRLPCQILLGGRLEHQPFWRTGARWPRRHYTQRPRGNKEPLKASLTVRRGPTPSAVRCMGTLYVTATVCGCAASLSVNVVLRPDPAPDRTVRCPLRSHAVSSRRGGQISEKSGRETSLYLTFTPSLPCTPSSI